MMNESISTKSNLDFYIFNKWGGLLPFLVIIVSIITLSIEGNNTSKAFWASGFMAMAIGLVFSKNKKDYCESLMTGIANKNSAIIILAWIFASILGKILVGAGLVGGLLWLFSTSGVTGSMFVVITFLSAALLASGTGTSNGTAIALAPILYPAGLYLGCDPVFLALALLSGGVLGDNIAPISDTTIVSAYSQNAKMQHVVRSRMPFALIAGAISIIVFYIFGNGTPVKIDINLVEVAPHNLLLLLSLVVVILSALRNGHILESLTYGIITASVTALLIGSLTLNDFFSIPEVRGVTTGIIQKGIDNIVSDIMFVLFIMASVQVFINSGLLRDFIDTMTKTIATNKKQAEGLIFGSSILGSMIVPSNGGSLLLIGPTIAKPLATKFKIAKSRAANLLDCGVCSIFYLVPWSLAVVVWYSALENAAIQFNLPLPDLSMTFLTPYPWALFLVMLFSIISGWKSKGIEEEETDLLNFEHKGSNKSSH